MQRDVATPFQSVFGTHDALPTFKLPILDNTCRRLRQNEWSETHGKMNGLRRVQLLASGALFWKSQSSSRDSRRSQDKWRRLAYYVLCISAL